MSSISRGNVSVFVEIQKYKDIIIQLHDNIEVK